MKKFVFLLGYFSHRAKREHARIAICLAAGLLVAVQSAGAETPASARAKIGIVMEQPATGVVIAQTYKVGPAEKAGLQRGDLVMSVDGELVANPTDLQMALSRHLAGEGILLTVNRKGWVRTVRLVLISEAALSRLSINPNPPQSISAATVQGVRSASIAPDASSGLSPEEVENIRDPFLRARNTAFD